MERIKKFLIYFILIIFSAVLVLHFFNIAWFFFILFVSLLFLIGYKWKFKYFTIFLFVSAFLTRLLATILIDSPITSDYATMYHMAREMVSGNINAATDSFYMNMWGYQMGYTTFMAGLLYIINDPLIIKIVNCIFSSLTVLFVYLIGKEIATERSSRIASLLYMLFPFSLLFNTVLSNQHIVTFLVVLVVYLLVSEKGNKMNSYLKFLLIGLCLAIANIIRPESIVFIVAILLYLILTTKRNEIKKACLSFVIMLVTYFSICFLSGYILQATNISPSGLANNNPVWKFIVGFNHDTKGGYSADDAEKYLTLDEGEQWEIVFDRTIKSFDKLPSLFINKADTFWLGSDLSWSLAYLQGKGIMIFDNEILFDDVRFVIDFINEYMILIIFILCILGIWYKRKDADKKMLLLLSILFVYFCVYLLIEVTPRYAYTAQVFVFIISSLGIDMLIKQSENIINGRRRLKK